MASAEKPSGGKKVAKSPRSALLGVDAILE
jgi:hypothetical protein